jgi:hypothetical protein
MLTLADLSNAIAAYSRGEMCLFDFEEWFRTVSRGMFGESASVLQAGLAIEETFSRYHFEGISEDQVRMELMEIVQPPSVCSFANQSFWDQPSAANSNVPSGFLPIPGNRSTPNAFNVAT